MGECLGEEFSQQIIASAKDPGGSAIGVLKEIKKARVAGAEGARGEWKENGSETQLAGRALQVVVRSFENFVKDVKAMAEF